MTQNEWLIEELLKEGKEGGITALDALRSFGIGRLASRICELREEGYKIERRMVTVIKADGTKTSVARYSLDPKDACERTFAYATTKIRAVQNPDFSVCIEEDTDTGFWSVSGWWTVVAVTYKEHRILTHAELKTYAMTYKQEKYGG